MNRLTRVFLVLLRLAIGWQILVEGVDKLGTLEIGPVGIGRLEIGPVSIGPYRTRSADLTFGPAKARRPWSSESYLREANGPTGPFFRKYVLGNPDEALVQHLTVEDGNLPPVLEEEWDFYFERFAQHYGLDEPQRARAEAILAQRKQKTLRWLQGEATRAVRKTFPSAPVVVDQTLPQRLADFAATRKEIRDLEGSQWSVQHDVARDKLVKAKADLRRMRDELQGDLAEQTEGMKRALAGEPNPAEQEATSKRAAVPLLGASTVALIGSSFGNGPVFATSTLAPGRADKVKLAPVALLSAEQRDLGPVPEPTRPRAGDLLDWAWSTRFGFRDNGGVRPAVLLSLAHLDWITKWGLTLVGLGLLLGLFTRTSSAAGAFFLVLFYLEMAPFPWLAQSPMNEGHYLYINKTLIEALALLALATTRSGRWFGLDGLMQFLPRPRWRRRRQPAWDGMSGRGPNGEAVTVSRAARPVAR
jgi:uncharacterized membrane protein YphA (DoxX/SURF4 family)